MAINLRQLEAFRAVIVTGSITGAAFEPLDPPPCVCVPPKGHPLLRHAVVRAALPLRMYERRGRD